MSDDRLTTGKSCKRCKTPLDAKRLELGAVFCSARCKRRYHQRNTPSYKRAQRKAQQRTPFVRFQMNTVHTKRLKVADTEHAQMQARRLIRAGMCAYENRQGVIRDLGVPKQPKNAGRIYRNKAGSAPKQHPRQSTLAVSGRGDA